MNKYVFALLLAFSLCTNAVLTNQERKELKDLLIKIVDKHGFTKKPIE